MPYRITILPRARRELAKLPANIAERVARAVDALEHQPRPPGCKKLAGKEDLWRIRVGEYRVVYQIRDAELLLLVVRIGHRRGIYKGEL
jgi:mRNA interferase RelE/StbE